MAALDFDATTTPRDVVAALSLTAQSIYAAQNTSTTATLFVREAAAAPTPGARAFKVEAGSPFELRPLGEPIYLWTDDPQGCPVILNLAP